MTVSPSTSSNPRWMWSGALFPRLPGPGVHLPRVSPRSGHLARERNESLGKRLSPNLDRAGVILPEQPDAIGTTIDDQSKQVEDIATEDTPVEGFRFDETANWSRNTALPSSSWVNRIRVSTTTESAIPPTPPLDVPESSSRSHSAPYRLGRGFRSNQHPAHPPPIHLCRYHCLKGRGQGAGSASHRPSSNPFSPNEWGRADEVISCQGNKLLQRQTTVTMIRVALPRPPTNRPAPAHEWQPLHDLGRHTRLQ